MFDAHVDGGRCRHAKTETVMTQIVAALSSSGFPFQTAITRLVEETSGWSVLEKEWPWRDTDGNEGFLDLVATNGKCVVSIECKKTRKEVFTFLYPSGQSADQSVERVSCAFSSQIQDSTRRVEVFGGEWRMLPSSAESTFCVVSTSQTGRDQRMLEKDARTLVRATDAYADHYRRIFHPQAGVTEPDRPFVPFIVTNAQLFLASYQPSDVSLQTGELAGRPTAISPIKCVRFRKAFTAGGFFGDRTVIVVHAESMTDLLLDLEAIVGPPGDERQHLEVRNRH